MKVEEVLDNKNVMAFLEMIRHSEGTAGVNGYRTLFGGALFDSFGDHPKQFFKYTNKAGEVINTSAAGAYQIIYTTWCGIKRNMGLTDFSEHSQDMAAVSLISDAGAIDLIINGQFEAAVNKVRKVWASLPGSGCNQPEHSLTAVQGWYEAAGGTVVSV